MRSARPRALRVRVAVEDEAGVVMSDRDQLGMGGEICEPQGRQAALPCAQHLAGAAQLEILLGNAKPVIGFAQGGEPLPRHLAQRRLVQQQASRGLVAAPDAAAQLVQLGKAKALGVLDDHDRRRRHIDPDLDHRRRHQQVDRLAGEPGRDPVLLRRLHPAVDQADAAGRQSFQGLAALARSGEIGLLGFVDQRADPISLGLLGQRAADRGGDLALAFERHRAGVDRLPARWLFIARR